MNTSKHRTAKIILTVCSLVAVVAVVGMVIYSEGDAAVIARADPAMKLLAERAGMSEKGMAIFLRTEPQLASKEAVAQACAGGNVKEMDGCYDSNSGRIFLRDMPSEFDSYEAVTASHEMLHAAIGTSDIGAQEIKELLFAELKQEDNQVIRDALLDYNLASSAEMLDEVHSFIGSQTRTVDPALEAYYGEYFVDRSKVTAVYEDVTNFFKAKEVELATSVQGINSAMAYADQLYAKHEAAAYGGSVYFTNLYYEDYMRAYDDAQSRIETYNSDVEAYNTMVESFNGRPLEELAPLDRQ